MDAVDVRAFRGSRRSAVYQRCVLPRPSAERMRGVAARAGLATLASVLAKDDAKLSKDDAHRLADDLSALRRSGELLDLDEELVQLTDVTHWCSRAAQDAWVTIRRV